MLAAKGTFNPSQFGHDAELIDLARVAFNEQKQRAVAKLKRHGFDVESDSLPPVSLLGTHGSASSAQRSPPRPPAPRMVLVGRAGNIIPPVRRA
jgi:hypothetical protein